MPVASSSQLAITRSVRGRPGIARSKSMAPGPCSRTRTAPLPAKCNKAASEWVSSFSGRGIFNTTQSSPRRPNATQPVGVSRTESSRTTPHSRASRRRSSRGKLRCSGRIERAKRVEDESAGGDDYFSSQSGRRFSMKAAIPSSASPIIILSAITPLVKRYASASGISN